MLKFSKSLNFEHKVYICAIVVFMLVTIFINFIVSNKIEKLENQLQTCTALLKLEKQTSGYLYKSLQKVEESLRLIKQNCKHK